MRKHFYPVVQNKDYGLKFLMKATSLHLNFDFHLGGNQVQIKKLGGST